MLERWRDNPVAFVRECFGVEPDAWQRGVLERFPTKRRQAMKACKGPGKTTVLAWLAWNFLSTRLYPKIAAVSISGDNLRDGLWAEMAKWQRKSEFLTAAFTWGIERIVANDAPEDWWMSARAWSKSADANQQAHTLAGLHADNVMFIIDEAGGVPDGVAAAAEAGLANVVDPTVQEAHLLLAGNPTHLEGPLYRACTSEAHLWDVTEITADPDDPNRSPRVSIDWAREQIERHGRDNPWVLVNVFGKFPPSSLNSLLGPDDVASALARVLPLGSIDGQAKLLGVDVARFGDDRTVIFPRQGRHALDPIVMRSATTIEIAARVVNYAIEWQADAIFVDGSGGYGAGVVDQVRQSGLTVFEIPFSGKPNDPRYFNKRSEMWWLLAEWVKTGGKLPKSAPEITRELTAPTYTFSGGKLRLEEKDLIKARIGASPDLCDALCLTYAMPVLARAAIGAHGNARGNVTNEYDPMAEMRRR